MYDRESKVKQFVDGLVEAAARIGGAYIQMPVADGDDVQRERVYCYELYHHLREIMSGQDWPDHVLAGEVDKTGHPTIVREIGNVKPDFIVHGPGSTLHNLAVVEVKPAVRARSGADDIRKLVRFTELHAGPYEAGVLLVFGDAEGLATELDTLKRIAEVEGRGRVSVLWHRGAGEQAQRL